MALQMAALNSGSNGNCYYVGNSTEAVLVDVGITCKEVEQRMKRMGLDIGRVKAIFISHEHSDHINGIPMLCKRYSLPVYVTKRTLRNCKFWIDHERINHFAAHTPVVIGNLAVTAFPKFHDAAEPHSFVVADSEVTIGVFTDIGQTCQQLVHYFAQCDAAFLESNYDTDMLDKGHYPHFLKTRIRSGHGHLSNAQAAELVATYKSPGMSHLVLSHLSKENNCAKKVQALFEEHAGDTKVVVASRFVETPLFDILGGGVKQPVVYKKPVAAVQQMAMF